MFSPGLDRNPPWFFNHIESFSHILFDIKFDKCDLTKDKIEFNIELDVRGYEGLLFFIYKPNTRDAKFDIINQKEDSIHTLKNMYHFPRKDGKAKSVDFIIIPFGHFSENNKLIPSIHCTDGESGYQVFTWTPSMLFKKVKSIIKIGNQYNEIIPLDDFDTYYFHFGSGFKGNKTEMLFNLHNILINLESTEEANIEVADIKSLITKTNEFLFEISQKPIPIEMQDLLKELDRLKFNIASLSKEEIYTWLDNLINFYSGRG